MGTLGGAPCGAGEVARQGEEVGVGEKSLAGAEGAGGEGRKACEGVA